MMLHDPRHYARSWREYKYGIGLSRDLGQCPVCGLIYVHESEEDRRYHRNRHREILAIYEPKPLPALATLHAKHGTFVPLDDFSPRPLRRRLEGAARMFRREKGYDFAPYSADEIDRIPSRHWIISTENGRPMGGLSARWREYSDAPPQWVWAWAWIIPTERRKGWMSRCWDMLMTIPDLRGIEPEPPFSLPVAKFFHQRNDVSEHIRAIAVRAIKRSADDDD